MCGGRIHRQTGKPQKHNKQQPLSLRAGQGSRRLFGSLAAFFVSSLDSESQVPVGQSSAAVLHAGGPGFRPRHETGWLYSFCVIPPPFRPRCCCGSLKKVGNTPLPFHFIHEAYTIPGSSVGVVTGLRAVRPRSRGSNPGSSNLMYSPKVRTGSGAHPASCLMSTGVSGLGEAAGV